jgi:hypothetical protein
MKRILKMMKAKYNLRFFAHKRFASVVAAAMVFALGVVLAACGSGAGHREGPPAKDDKLSRFTEAVHVPPVEEKMLLVIPTSGCGPCIQSALEFTAKHENTTKLSVVVSGRSKRFRTLLVRKFGVDTAKVVFDKEALASQWGMITIYPTLFRVNEQGKIDSAALSPEAKEAVLVALAPQVE